MKTDRLNNILGGSVIAFMVFCKFTISEESYRVLVKVVHIVMIIVLTYNIIQSKRKNNVWDKRDIGTLLGFILLFFIY